VQNNKPTTKGSLRKYITKRLKKYINIETQKIKKNSSGDTKEEEDEFIQLVDEYKERAIKKLTEQVLNGSIEPDILNKPIDAQTS
jgi:hypothetical protein